MLVEAEAHIKAVMPEEKKQNTVRMSPCRYSPMIYFPHDFYIGGSLEKYGEYNRDEAELLHQYIQEGDLVVEVGANIGTHTVPIAKWVGERGRVLAFEPQRVLFQMMCGNLAVAALWNVFAVQEAVGDQAGMIAVPTIDYAKEGNFGGVSLGTGTEQVAVRTLDSVGIPKCALIKIDVEGMEANVVRGALNMINKFRPILYLENDRENKKQELINLLHSLHYKLWWHLPPLFSPDNYRNDQENIFGDVVSINMLCLPEEGNHPEPKGLNRIDNNAETSETLTSGVLE